MVSETGSVNDVLVGQDKQDKLACICCPHCQTRGFFPEKVQLNEEARNYRIALSPAAASYSSSSSSSSSSSTATTSSSSSSSMFAPNVYASPYAAASSSSSTSNSSHSQRKFFGGGGGIAFGNENAPFNNSNGNNNNNSSITGGIACSPLKPGDSFEDLKRKMKPFAYLAQQQKMREEEKKEKTRRKSVQFVDELFGLAITAHVNLTSIR